MNKNIKELLGMAGKVFVLGAAYVTGYNVADTVYHKIADKLEARKNKKCVKKSK